MKSAKKVLTNNFAIQTGAVQQYLSTLAEIFPPSCSGKLQRILGSELTSFLTTDNPRLTIHCTGRQIAPVSFVVEAVEKVSKQISSEMKKK
jgi:hypothetical protein